MESESNNIDLTRVYSFLASVAIITTLLSLVCFDVGVRIYLSSYNAIWLLPQFLGATPTYFFLLIALILFFFNGPFMLGFVNGISLSKMTILSEEKQENFGMQGSAVVKNRKTIKFFNENRKEIFIIILSISAIVFYIAIRTSELVFFKARNFYVKSVDCIFYVSVIIFISFLYHKFVDITIPKLKVTIRQNLLKDKTKPNNFDLYLSKANFLMIYLVYAYFYYLILLKSVNNYVISLVLSFILPILFRYLGTMYGVALEGKSLTLRNISLILSMSFVVILFPITIDSHSYTDFAKVTFKAFGLGSYSADITCRGDSKNICKENNWVLANTGTYMYLTIPKNKKGKIFQIPRDQIISIKTP